jgi:3-methylcrotonyl-CoA carboxylase alpha subunit
MTKQFSRILIANRGEIACRIIRTARRMGIATVAVYSDADRDALHVRQADEAVRIGPPLVAESYLRMENIIQAALDTGAEAVHPGYGFLSENPEFVEAVEAAGLVFIGPSASAIRAMGLKDAAKALMEKAKVPVVPGYHGEMQEPGFLAAKANEIGYPVLIKARAGGGGKGMRRVDEPKAFSAALASCRSEARSSFGDDRVLIEKYIETPRHIEVQVFGDNHGNVVHLFERDCSLQRRHQKVIEEAPAPGMTEKMREAMTSAAVKAAKAINYSGAGTIEFIVDGASALRPDGFWFMEMNTRLQVEHPVTEMITGLDLVEWQLRVAHGEKLPLQQDEIAITGHAFEARLYAEDVPRGFLPATGKLQHLDFPENVRIDTGVIHGDAITPYYDPMIAKIISSGKDREAALGQLYAALQHTRIAGTVTNREFLAALCCHEGFMAGNIDTGLIERDLEKLVPAQHQQPENAVTAALIHILAKSGTGSVDPFDQIGAFALWGARHHSIRLQAPDRLLDVRLATKNGIDFTAEIEGARLEISATRDANTCGRIKIVSKGKQKTIAYAAWPGHIALFLEEQTLTFQIPDPLERDLGDFAGADRITAPMPGLVKNLYVKTGQSVLAGDPLLVLEAMKMEHTLTAPRDGRLAEVAVGEGDQVEDGALLVAMAEEET